MFFFLKTAGSCTKYASVYCVCTLDNTDRTKRTNPGYPGLKAAADKFRIVASWLSSWQLTAVLAGWVLNLFERILNPNFARKKNEDLMRFFACDQVENFRRKISDWKFQLENFRRKISGGKSATNWFIFIACCVKTGNVFTRFILHRSIFFLSIVERPTSRNSID